MKRSMHRALFSVLVPLLLASPAARAEEPARTGACAPDCFTPQSDRPLRFGLSPYLTANLLRSAFEPVLARIAERLGRPIELVIPEAYGDMLPLLQQGELDLAYLTPLLYVKARRLIPGLRLMVTDVWHGIDFYTGYLMVRADSDITSLDQLRGRRLAFVDRESASGYIYPKRELTNRGFPPATTFAEIVFAGDHVRVLAMLLDRKVDAAAVSSGTLATLRRHRTDVGNVRVLLKTGTIPHDVICAAPTLDPDVVERLTGILLDLNSRTAEGRAVLPRLPRLNGWRQGNPSDYDELERVWTQEEAAP